MTTPTNSPPQRRLQFSLGTLLSSVVALGAVLGLWFANKENARLRAENAQMRSELGRLEVDDPRKIYICRVKTNTAFATPFDPEQWCYRIYVPKGNYRFGYQRDEVTSAGPNRAHAEYAKFGELDGEFELLLAHHIDDTMTSDLEFRVRPTTPGSKVPEKGQSSSVVVKEKDGFGPVYFAFTPTPTADVPVKWGQPHSFQSSATILLIALKCPLSVVGADGQQTLTPTTQPGPGLLVWLERDPDSAAQ